MYREILTLYLNRSVYTILESSGLENNVAKMVTVSINTLLKTFSKV